MHAKTRRAFTALLRRLERSTCSTSTEPCASLSVIAVAIIVRSDLAQCKTSDTGSRCEKKDATPPIWRGLYAGRAQLSSPRAMPGIQADFPMEKMGDANHDGPILSPDFARSHRLVRVSFSEVSHSSIRAHVEVNALHCAAMGLSGFQKISKSITL